ncbi:MAG: sigma-70 family RNA polymerase sigma factor [Kofleriaceae bacterium]
MDGAEHEARLAQLTAEMAWLRRLARALLGQHADDLAHDTWIAAATGAPTDRPLRPWLGRVALNLARMSGRSQARRTRREEVFHAPANLVPTPEELIRRVELQRLVAGEVLALREPYRSTVLLHYFEELSCAEIARRLQLSDGTVRRRLKVALDELRSRLGKRDGKPDRGLAILAPLAGIPSPRRASIPFASGALVMKKLAIVIALALAILAVWWWRRDPDPDSSRGHAERAANAQHGPVARPVGDAERPLPVWFTARDAPERRIAGRVTFEGAPVANASVMLHHTLSRAGIVAAQTQRTGSDGRFDLGSQSPRGYHIIASSPGKTDAIVAIELSDPLLKPPADRLELELRACTSSVHGMVLDASGGPIARVKIRREGLVGVDADDRGAYRLCLPRGDTEVTFAAEGYGTVLLTIDAQGEARQDVVLVPEAIVRGRVVDDANRLVADAQVGVFAKPWSRDRGAHRSVLSGPDGRFRITGLVPGRYAAHAFADGVTSTQAELVATVGESSEELVLRVIPHARVRGKVMSGSTPIAGARVVATQLGTLERSSTGISQADGSFVLASAPIGELAFAAAPYQVIAPLAYAVEGAREHVVTLEVTKLATIRGQVTRSGKPVAGAHVFGASTVRSPSPVTDLDGRYEILGVLPGAHEIGAQHLELGAFTEGRRVQITGSEEREVNLELDLAAAITGVVIDQDSRPVPNVFVRWTHDKTGDLGKSITRADGRFRCDAMTGGGRYRAAVYATTTEQSAFSTADGKPHPVVELVNGSSSVDGVRLAIELRPLSISGRVVDGDGKPVADAQIRALAMPSGDAAPQFHSWQRLAITFAAEDGSFELPGLTRGRYALNARSADGGEATILRVEAGASGVALAVERPGLVEGTIAGFPTPPLVIASALDGPVAMPAQVDRTTFRITGLRRGRYLISAQTRFEGDARIVEIRPGITTKLALTARGRGAIEASVIDFRTRAPLADAYCQVVVAADGMIGQPVGDWLLAPRTDARGRVTIDPAPAGRVTIECRVPSYRMSPASAELSLAPGGRAVIQLASVELLTNWPSTIGIELDARVTAPRIAHVSPDGPAASAGVLAGDLVTSVDGVLVTALNGAGVVNLIDSNPVGKQVTLVVARGTGAKTITVTTQPRRYR